MPILKNTESQLPKVYPSEILAGPTNYFNSRNAAILGYHHLDSDTCLVSYLPETILTLTKFDNNIQNRYTVFINGVVGDEYDYEWSIDYNFSAPPLVVNFIDTTGLLNTPNLLVDLRKMGLEESRVGDLTGFSVKCKVTKITGGATVMSNLTLNHQIGEAAGDLDLLSENTTNTESLAQAGDPQTTHLTANIIRDLCSADKTWYGRMDADAANVEPTVNIALTDTVFPSTLNIPASIIYARLLKVEADQYFPEFNSEYYEMINGAGSLEVFKNHQDNLVGICALKPHLAASCLPDHATFQRIGGSVKEEDLLSDFEALSLSKKIDVYNYCRFPKSAFLLSTLYIQKLVTEAGINNHAQFKAKAGKISEFNSNPTTLSTIQDDKYVKNIIFEYISGPQTNIGGLEYFFGQRKYRQVIAKVHSHDWSPYIAEILVCGISGISDAYFARKEVTVDAAGNKSVNFVKITTSVLGQEEYVVVKTNKLRSRSIKFQIKTASAQLTGTDDQTISLIKDGAATIDFTATVGTSTSPAMLDNSGVAYANASDFADDAIAKVVLRNNTEATFNTWNNNTPSGGATSALKIQVQLEVPNAGEVVYYGSPNPGDLPTDANTAHVFNNVFGVGHLDKQLAPRIKSAYFAKKVVNFNVVPAVVNFEKILDPTNVANAGSLAQVHGAPNPTANPIQPNGNARKWPLGMDVYVVIETVNLTGEEIELYVQSGDTQLTGVRGQILPLAENQTRVFQRSPITATGANVEAIHNNAGTHNYNVTGLEHKVIFKVPLRPSEANLPAIPGWAGMNAADRLLASAAARVPLTRAARAVFDTWAENIHGPAAAPNANQYTGLELFVKPVDSTKYVYYGAEPFVDYPLNLGNPVYPFDENAKSDGRLFLTTVGEKFLVENKVVYTIYNTTNTYNFLPEITLGVNQVRRRIGRIENDWARATGFVAATPTHNTEYFFFDQHDNMHALVERVRKRVMDKARPVARIPNAAARGAANRPWANFAPFIGAGDTIWAEELRYYANGTLATASRHSDRGDRWYANQVTASNLVDMDVDAPAAPGAHGRVYDSFDYQYGAPLYLRVRYGFGNSMRRHIQVDRYAGMLGALAEFYENGHHQYVAGEGFAYADSSSYPSVQHVNGQAGDLYYMDANDGGNAVGGIILQSAGFDRDDNEALVDLLYEFGWARTGNLYSENYVNRANLSVADDVNGRMRHTNNVRVPRHNNHLHIRGFGIPTLSQQDLQNGVPGAVAVPALPLVDIVAQNTMGIII